MAHDLGNGRRSVSPESSGRDSPIPRQWRNQLGAEDAPTTDKAYRKYATGVERALTLFETNLHEWADYISFLNRLLRALQARQPSVAVVPSKALVAKRLSQCLNPSLPSGVHQKALEVYGYVFGMIGLEGLSRDLPLYLPGLAPTLSFASLSVRSPYLDLLEQHFLRLDPRSLRPAMKSLILALLPGLEDETSEDFDRTMKLTESFKVAIRPTDSVELSPTHFMGDDFFWQCFFLASITSHSRRGGALAYLVRNLPKLGDPALYSNGQADPASKVTDIGSKLGEIVTSPEPGLLLRCFAAGLSDEQLLIQRGFLDLLVTHLPLQSKVLQTRVKPADLELLLKAASSVVIRREMGLNRRLWAWLLGPDPSSAENDTAIESPSTQDHQTSYMSSKTNYFEEYGLQALTHALLSMIYANSDSTPAERARPYRICLSLMDRWEIGGLIVPEVFLPIVDSVRKYKKQSSSKSDFNEVFRSASVFFDGVESGLIYGEMISLLAQAIGPGSSTLGERLDKLELVNFIVDNFNVREEEMVTIHAPLAALSVFCMVGDAQEKQKHSDEIAARFDDLADTSLSIALALLDLVPERAFPSSDSGQLRRTMEQGILSSLPAVELLKRVKTFYVNEQGNVDAVSPPFSPVEVGELLVLKAGQLVCETLSGLSAHLGSKGRILTVLLSKVPSSYEVDTSRILACLHSRLDQDRDLSFPSLNTVLYLSTHLYFAKRTTDNDLSRLVTPIVRHAWTFLSLSEPKYHVEVVRLLWQFQSALTPANRSIEAALASLIVAKDIRGTFAARPADPGRRFAVLWSHTLQDSQADRRGSRTPLAEKLPLPRMSGVDYYDVMLTRPLFLMLDALLDERTQLFMVVKSWLNSLIGVDKLFLVFVHKFASLSYLGTSALPAAQESTRKSPETFSEDDDLDVCLYYLRTLSNVFRWGPEAMWAILASTTLNANGTRPEISRITGKDGDVSLQEFFLQVCMRCIDGASTNQKSGQTAQLYRYALTTLHQILLNPYAETSSSLHLETVLIERLTQSLSGPDPYVQVLLLDVVFATLKLNDSSPGELPTSPTSEKSKFSMEPGRGQRPSLQVDRQTRPNQPPPNLLKCLQAGLSSPSSRSVLESWVNFLTECLPLYADTIFQVLIPLVETLCKQVSSTFTSLQAIFREDGVRKHHDEWGTPEATLISLLNALEQVLARAHERLLVEETRVQVAKGPEQPQGFFGNMVSGVFASETQQARSITANDRLTVHLAFQDAVRICFTIWSWGQRSDVKSQDPSSVSSFNYTSLRMRNRARRLLEHLFAAETLECLETVIDIWRDHIGKATGSQSSEVLNLLPALDGSRPRHTIPAIFNSIYSRTNPSALEPSLRSTLTISLQDTDLVTFLVEYARSLEDDTMDEIWQDCMAFLRDLLANPFPHRQTLPSLLEFAAILGEKVDNTNFGEQRKMRRELGDLFLRLLTAVFTTKPMAFVDPVAILEKGEKTRELSRRSTLNVASSPFDRAEDVVAILASIVPNLPKVLVDNDRVLSAAGTISTNVVGPAFRAKAFPETVTHSTLALLQELSRLPNNQKTWKKDLSDAFNDGRFFNSDVTLVKSDWLPLLRQWTMSDKERLVEILGRLTPPTTAGIVFGVGATSARLEADRKTQLNLRRLALLVLAANDDAFVGEIPGMMEKLIELLVATSTSSPSSITRAEIFMLVRALVLKNGAIHLAMIWPVINAEIHAAISSVVAPDHSKAADTYNNMSILQACKLVDLLICVAPDDFQLHEWLFITDTIDAVYRSTNYQPVALVDELSEELGAVAVSSSVQNESAAHLAASSAHRRPLLGPGGIDDEISVDRKDELVGKILRPFFGQLSIFAFESTYTMSPLDTEFCIQGLLKDIFDERSVVKAL